MISRRHVYLLDYSQCDTTGGEEYRITQCDLPGTNLATYGASKAAVRNQVRRWALSAQERKFRVNVLPPGPTETPGPVGAVSPDHRLASQVPLRRIGRPDEIAAVATLLASDASNFVNGADWFVDGGLAQV